jgi:hypothetical protein
METLWKGFKNRSRQAGLENKTIGVFELETETKNIWRKMNRGTCGTLPYRPKYTLWEYKKRERKQKRDI